MTKFYYFLRPPITELKLVPCSEGYKKLFLYSGKTLLGVQYFNKYSMTDIFYSIADISQSHVAFTEQGSSKDLSNYDPETYLIDFDFNQIKIKDLLGASYDADQRSI